MIVCIPFLYCLNLTLKDDGFLIAANSQVVDLDVLFMPHVLGTEWDAYFPIRRCKRRNFSLWRKENNCQIFGGLLWVSPWFSWCSWCCSHCHPHCNCHSICLLHWKPQFPEEVKWCNLQRYHCESFDEIKQFLVNFSLQENLVQTRCMHHSLLQP